MTTYSLWGSNPRPMAHKTIALTTELRELLQPRGHCNTMKTDLLRHKSEHRKSSE